MKRFLEVLILLPLAIIGLALAVANRHAVTVSFDPFTSTAAGAIEVPLFVVLIAAIVIGVLLGGFFTGCRRVSIAGPCARVAPRLHGCAARRVIPKASVRTE